MKKISLGISLLGLLILIVTLGPIGFYQLNGLLQPKLIDPTKVSRIAIFDESSVLAANDSNTVDYTNSKNWFEGANTNAVTSSRVNYYTVSVPSLNINNVTVEINGTDLKKNAIQFPGTAVPGTYGNTVIFGHSTLPQLYRPGSFLSEFTPLPEIKKGAEIIINYDGVTYRYVVRDTAVVKPSQIEVLAQRYDKYELTLITCVPLGTYLNRFIARAELVNWLSLGLEYN